MSDIKEECSQWEKHTLNYTCRFGEIRVFDLKMKGYLVAPNIFEYSNENELLIPKGTQSIYCARSLPCESHKKHGVEFTDGYIHHIVQTYRHYYVDTSGDFDEYLLRFKGKSRSSLNRKINKVTKSNKTEECFQVFSKPDEVEAFLKIAKSISQKSYQEVLIGRALSTEQDFLEDIKGMAEKGLFRGYLLYVKDKAVAYNLCPVYGNGVLFYDWTGYNPKYSKYSPGTVLQYEIVKNAFSDNSINFYDLCSGEGRHKEMFMTGYRFCCDVYYFPLTAKNLLIIYSRVTIEGVGKLITSILKKVGIADKIKKIIRRFK